MKNPKKLVRDMITKNSEHQHKWKVVGPDLICKECGYKNIPKRLEPGDEGYSNIGMLN